MKYFILLLLMPLFGNSQNYWQQTVDYKIDVKLDDENHLLRGFETFDYTNNSPNILDTIFIHVWPNAYIDGETDLGKQNYAAGNKILKFGNDSLKGCIDSLNFKVNGAEVKWQYTTKRDIVFLVLSQPLNPGGKISVSTPFKVTIPSGKISRLGHIDQSYQITQWYPKPAVYDKNGWHAIPYLNQGEFYSEFGSFDVSITLPKNYVVGATGDLQTKSEIDFLNNLSAETEVLVKNLDEETGQKDVPLSSSESKALNKNFPISDSQTKTIRYVQKNVHDFAWFADKRYKVLKGEVELPNSKRKVTTWAMFTPGNMSLWRNAIEYINDGTYYYSLWNGDYPYNQVTAVDGTISAGGGMEYPNVTVIGNASSMKELEVVIVHEVGHNWFYGILGSNERDHGWMDEGMNTLNEIRYIQTKYPDNDNLSDMILGGMFHFENLSHKDMADFSYRAMSRLALDQPIETKSADFTSINYGIIMYQKTGIVFHYLKDYLGDEMFNKCMHNYFEEWKFKHPQPEDMQASLEKTCGEKLDWLFYDLIQTTNHIDYKITKVRKGENGDIVYVKNVGQVAGPIPVSAMNGDSVLTTMWLKPGEKKGKLNFSEFHSEYTIDPNHNISELDRTNNSYNSDQLFNKLEPLKLYFGSSYNEPNKTNMYIIPAMGYNLYDQYMLGVAFHNLAIIPNKFQYFIAPMYSFGGKRISGTAEFMRDFLPKKVFKLAKIGLSLKSFKFDDETFGSDIYYSFSPYLNLKIGNRKNQGPWDHNVLLLTNFNYNSRSANSTDAILPFSQNNEQRGGYLQYTGRYTKPDYEMIFIAKNDYQWDNYSSNFFNEKGIEFHRIQIAATNRYKYLKNKKNKWAEIRLYYGNVYSHTELNSIPGYQLSQSFLTLGGGTPSLDNYKEEYYVDRQGTSDIFSNQQNDNLGNFKTGVFRGSYNYVFTATSYIDLPLKTNLFGAFVDYGIVPNNGVMNHYFNTGIGIRLSKIFGIYFPLYNSDNLNTNSNEMFDQYGSKIRFTLKINPVNSNFKISF